MRIDKQKVKDLAFLYYLVTKGAMDIPDKKWKLWFTHQEEPSVEAFIEQIQTKIESILQRETKKSLTLRKGIPYSIVGATEFIDEFLKEILE